MSLSAADYAIQGVLLLLVLVYPWFLPPGRRLLAFGLPFLAFFGWGIWRIAYFDLVTNNDIPGMGYICCAFGYPLITLALYTARCAFLRFRANRSAQSPEIPPPPQPPGDS